VFVGKSAGAAIQTGSQNTMIGNGANVPSTNTGATNRTAIGYGAIASQNNTVVLGGANANMEVWAGNDKQGDVFATDGTFTGTVTGNVTGGLTGDVTGNVTGNVTGGLTGDVTGNVTGNLTGNAATASALSVAIGLNDLSDVHSNGSNLIFGGAYTTQSDQAAYLGNFGYTNVNIFGYGAGLGANVTNQVVLGNSLVNYVFAGSDWGASVYAANVSVGSDRRFKTNIKDVDSQIEKLGNIKSKIYTNIKTGEIEFGVIAQEIQQIYPELISEIDYISDDNEETKSVKRLAVNYTGFVPILIKTINEQQVMIEKLQSKVDEIEVLKQEIQMIKDMMNN